jgi:hypothetical protein
MSRFIKGKDCPECRFLYTHTLTPKEGDEKRSMLLAFAPDKDLSGFEAAIKAAAQEAGKGDVKFRSPIKPSTYEKQSGETYEDQFPELKGYRFVNVSTYRDFPIVGTRKGADGKLEHLDPSSVRMGDYGRCGLAFRWFERDGNRGVTVNFSGVQKLRDGEPLGEGGGPNVDDEFGDDVSANAARANADAAIDSAEGEWIP